MIAPTASTTASTREVLDTNILIYAVDVHAGWKHNQARDLVRQLVARDALAVSAQILNEFYWSATRTHKAPGMTHDEAVQFITTLVNSSVVLPLTTLTTLRALDALPRHGFSFWDTLIWAAASESGIQIIHSEDFQHGRDVEGVRFQNPFSDSP